MDKEAIVAVSWHQQTDHTHPKEIDNLTPANQNQRRHKKACGAFGLGLLM
jgi:hypothetical protein